MDGRFSCVIVVCCWRVTVAQVKEGARGTEGDYLDDLDDRAEVEQVINC